MARQVDIAPPKAVEAVKECIRHILVAASTGHIVMGSENGPQIPGAALFTTVTTDTQVSLLNNLPSFNCRS